METLIRLNDEYGGRIGAQAGPLSRTWMFAEIEERVAIGETEMPGSATRR